MKQALHIIRLILLTLIMSSVFIEVALLVLGDQTRNHVLNILVSLLASGIIILLDGGIIKSYGKGNYGNGRN